MAMARRDGSYVPDDGAGDAEDDDLTVDGAPDEDSSTLEEGPSRAKKRRGISDGPKEVPGLALASRDGELVVVVPDGFYMPYRTVTRGRSRRVRLYPPKLDARDAGDIGHDDVRVELETVSQKVSSVYAIRVLGDPRLVASPAMHDLAPFFDAYQVQKHVRLRFSRSGIVLDVESAKTGARCTSVDVPLWTYYGRTRTHKKVEQVVTLGAVVPEARACVCGRGQCCLLGACVSCYDAETDELVRAKTREIEAWAHEVATRELERLWSQRPS